MSTSQSSALLERSVGEYEYEYEYDASPDAVLPEPVSIEVLVEELRRTVERAREVQAALLASDEARGISTVTDFELRSVNAVLSFVRPEEDFGSGLAGE